MTDIEKAQAAKTGKISRTTIQNTIEPGIYAGIASLELPPGPEAARRVFRALLHIGIRRLLAMECPPQAILAYCVEVLNKEIAASKPAEEAVEPAQEGQVINLFGTTPKGSA